MADKSDKKKGKDGDNIVVVSSEYFFACPVCETQLETKKEYVGKLKVCKKCFTNVLVPEEDGYSIPYGVICIDPAAFWRNHKKKVFIATPFLILAAVLLVLGIGSLWAVKSETSKSYNRQIARDIERIEADINGDRELSMRAIRGHASEIAKLKMEGLDEENEKRVEAAKRKLLRLWKIKEGIE